MLRLTRQPNGTLRGEACYFSDGYYVGWSGVPVVIDYPDVSVISGRFVFEGAFQDDHTISGNWAQGTPPHPMTLTPGGNYCGEK